MEQDTGMFTVVQTIGSVLCCKCGILMQPNAANMCAKCLRSEIDITEGLQKHVIIIHCPECDSYLQPPRTWLKAQLESKELLTFCVKRLKNLNTVRLIHAEFIWTEPHSKRIKVKLKVQKEVLNGAILEQAYTVEYVVQDQLCESCSRVQANPDQWVAAVQLRQHVSHRRTFFYLEQLILKHDAAKHAIRIKQMDQGIDFFFNKRSHGLKFVEFVGKVSPIRSRSDKQLVSHDQKSNNYNYKHTFSVEISPICREDLICLPPKVAVSLGNFGPLVICHKVSNSIAMQLVEYIVLDVEPVSSEVNIGGLRYVLADAQVARVSDFGKNDMIFNSYEEKRRRKRGKPRRGNSCLSTWRLIILLAKGRDNAEKMDSEYEQLLERFGGESDLRFNLSLYRNNEYHGRWKWLRGPTTKASIEHILEQRNRNRGHLVLLPEISQFHHSRSCRNKLELVSYSGSEPDIHSYTEIRVPLLSISVPPDYFEW
ncbi:hypothetical protein DH2020_047773 [Rehmannia glutinosa]|uniref:60S ribosomal export protein NMD3 n=1 Tax=Rehmannia glutinosa TaxID=99300 RepID=A0ABR0U7Q8_REHGL